MTPLLPLPSYFFPINVNMILISNYTYNVRKEVNNNKLVSEISLNKFQVQEWKGRTNAVFRNVNNH